MNDQMLDPERPQGGDIKFIAGMALLLSFGFTMMLFSLAYTKDLGTLAKAPELVWAFICGVPSDDGVTLPLMLTVSTLALLGGAGLGIWTWLRTRH